VVWDPVFSIDSNQSKPSHVHKHEKKYAGVWKIRSIIYDNLTVVISAASDGTIRYSFAGAKLLKKKYHIKPCQVFQIIDVENDSREHSHEASLNEAERESSGSVSKVVVAFETIVESENTDLISTKLNHPVSMHAVTSCELTDSEIFGYAHSNRERMKNGPNLVMLAYGGAAGLVRIHCRDLREDIII
jgi:hypothetical protein